MEEAVIGQTEHNEPANHTEHKRVEFTELFYDLVFVFAISKMTAVIHHLHHGIVSVPQLFAFTISILVLVSTWTIQTFFTNRYGRNSALNIAVMFVDMATLLLISNMISTEWQNNFRYFAVTLFVLALTQFIQFVVEYKAREHTDAENKLIRGMSLITGIRVLTSGLAAVLPVVPGVVVFLIGLIASIVTPFNVRFDEMRKIVNIPHIIERVSLLVIITFGEMIMGIVPFFTPESFTFDSVCYFIIIALLFLYYFGEYDHAIDESLTVTESRLFYTHYLVLFGLSMVTVSFTFLNEPEANHLFVDLFLYIRLLLIFLGVLLNARYNKESMKFTKTYYALLAAFFVVGFASCIFFASNFNVVTYITTAMLFAIVAHYTIFYFSRVRNNPELQELSLF